MSTNGEGDEATSPSFVAENAAIEVSSSSLEALIATWYIQRGCKRAALYPRQTKYPFADLQLFTSEEGDEVTSPSFLVENAAIEASSSSLEALIATL